MSGHVRGADPRTLTGCGCLLMVLLTGMVIGGLVVLAFGLHW